MIDRSRSAISAARLTTGREHDPHTAGDMTRELSMTSSSSTITSATAALDRAIDALAAAVDDVVEQLMTDEGELASLIIDGLDDVTPRVTTVDRLIRNLDRLAIERGEA